MNDKSAASNEAHEESSSLAATLAKSQDVKDRVQACADDLGESSDAVRQTLANGTARAAANVALVNNEQVAAEVQACANELHGVNASLTQSVADLEHTEQALVKSRSALARAQLELRNARAEEQAARYEALHDKLTGLPNRAHFDTRLEQAIATAKRHNRTLAVMFLDLNKFKQINDAHGHAAGDFVLCQIASRLSRIGREEDGICRNGGDEFLSFMVDPKGNRNIQRAAEAIQAKLGEPILWGAISFNIKVSIGISIYPNNGITGENLIQEADAAMYAAKRNPYSGWKVSEAPRARN